MSIIQCACLYSVTVNLRAVPRSPRKRNGTLEELVVLLSSVRLVWKIISSLYDVQKRYGTTDGQPTVSELVV